MTFTKAMAYFLWEAGLNLLRSWKVSLVAILTITVSLYVGGAFLTLSTNLSDLAARWRQDSKVVVYLESEASSEQTTAVVAAGEEASWVSEAQLVGKEESKQRFQELFPSLAELVEGSQENALPASVELTFDPDQAKGPLFDAWLEDLRSLPGVEMIDDDRDWLEQLSILATVVRTGGLGLALALLVAAVFTIASVVRLTAYLYSDEIAIMRLVGATEFFIRGPFYAEGLLQGLVGGLLAAGGLVASLLSLSNRFQNTAWHGVVGGGELPWSELMLLVGVGAIAGIF